MVRLPGLPDSESVDFNVTFAPKATKLPFGEYLYRTKLDMKATLTLTLTLPLPLTLTLTLTLTLMYCAQVTFSAACCMNQGRNFLFGGKATQIPECPSPPSPSPPPSPPLPRPPPRAG